MQRGEGLRTEPFWGQKKAKESSSIDKRNEMIGLHTLAVSERMLTERAFGRKAGSICRGANTSLVGRKGVHERWEGENIHRRPRTGFAGSFCLNERQGAP